MSDAKSQHEPSMEEILASIRRIIAEDNDAPEGAGEKAAPEAGPAVAAAAAPVVVPKDDDVLELTEVVEEDLAVNASPELAPQAPGLPAEPVFSLDPEPDIVPPPAAGADGDRLLSNTSAAVSVAALSQLVSRGQRDKSAELPLGAVSRTLEDMVLDLLRPMLKDWLDEHLPALVQRLVQDEIARLVREAQGR